MEKLQKTLTYILTALETYLAVNVLAPQEERLKKKSSYKCGLAHTEAK